MTPVSLTLYGRVAIVAGEGDVDAGGISDELQEIADAAVELQIERLSRRRIECRFRRHPARPLAHLVDLRARPARLDRLEDLAIELGGFGGELPVRRIVFTGALELPGRRIELPLGLEVLPRGGVDHGGFEHRSLERDPELWLVGILLNRLAIVRDRRVPVVSFGSVKAFAVARSPQCNQ